MTDSTSIDAPSAPADTSSLCEKKVASADLAIHYSLLFAPASVRRALTALYAFWHEVREIPIECSEPDVARVKLGWWHEELHGMYAGQPRHPIAKSLREAVTTHQLPTAPFFDVIEALAQHATSGHYDTYAALCDYGLRTRGTIEQLATRIVGGTDQPLVKEAGARLELTQLLIDAGRDAARGRNYFPQDDIDRFSASRTDIARGQASEAVRRLVSSHAERLRNELAAISVAAHKPSSHEHVASLLITIELARALLERVQKDPAIVFRERPTLLPLRQLWIAWRTARRTKR